MNARRFASSPVLFLASVAVAATVALAQPLAAEEVTLFDRYGKAVAYVDTDDEMTIYLWGGTPVAYLDGENLYGFNGKHLGWFEEGIIRDHEGHVVGFVEGAINVFTKFEPLKSFKQFKPFKSFKEFAPFKPVYADRWSSTSLSILLGSGRA